MGMEPAEGRRLALAHGCDGPPALDVFLVALAHAAVSWRPAGLAETVPPAASAALEVVALPTRSGLTKEISPPHMQRPFGGIVVGSTWPIDSTKVALVCAEYLGPQSEMVALVLPRQRGCLLPRESHRP